MIKIAIAGIGGVGGYFGGLLAQHFHHSNKTGIYFIARGENEKAIQQHGLQVETVAGNFIAHPVLATHDCSQIAPVDYLVICTKGYGLENMLTQIKPCVNKGT